MTSSFKAVDNDICRQALVNRGSLLLDSLCDHGATIDLKSSPLPLISIIVVAFNAPELLAVTMASLAAQGNLNRSSFEVIVVDNASDDETKALLNRLVGARIIPSETNRGFAGGSNLGASVAAGKYLLFVNPDIELLPGALDALVRAKESREHVGAVGGRLLFPGGRIQEAGAHFKNDGLLTHPYLRDARDPNAAEATYRRETGYVSGALLLIEKTLFDRLEGFDEAFTPAYFEDTDLCVRAARLGYATLYEPFATAVHFESSTSASREAVEALLDSHRKLFRDRHGKWIFANGDAGGSDLELRNFSVNELRILYIDDAVPHLDGGSGYPRSNAILNCMAAHGYFVSFYPLHRVKEKRQNLYRDLSPRIEIFEGSGVGPLSEILEQRRGYYDILWVSRPHNVEVVVDLFAQRGESMRDFVRSAIVFDAEAIFCLRDALKTYVHSGAIFGGELEAAVRREIRHYPVADHVICVSEAEKAMCESFGLANVRVLGHRMEAQRDTPGFSARAGLIFVGAVYEADSPNFDSLLWFKENVLALVRARLGAELTLTVVGSMPSEMRQALAGEGVKILGVVPDIAAHVNAARVFVAPTRYASGIPHKIHESVSRGLPAVVTPLLASQVGWPASAGYLVADWRDQKEFAEAIIRLHENEALWNALRQKGFDEVERDCDATAFSRTVRDICEWSAFA
ncbi:MAG TPA: glycosyltransferase [Methylocystis sp.]|nr:glycosyltransferase [Methylocystis sp.]